MGQTIIDIVRRKVLGSFILTLLILFSRNSAVAADLDLEKDLQGSLERSNALAQTISEKLGAGTSASAEIARLIGESDNVRAGHLLLRERFRQREEKIRSTGSKALERQKNIGAGYQQAIEEYLKLVDQIRQADKVSGSTVEQLRTFLDSVLHKRKKPILGSLPYRNLNYTAGELSSAPSITPAYLGGDQTSTSADLNSTAEAPVNSEIAALAQSLNWNPVMIYEYVKNNIETEWYWGCMKGAEDTLHQKSGNDCDQATLLAALPRASDYPTRYIRGDHEFFPDIRRQRNSPVSMILTDSGSSSVKPASRITR